MLPGPKKKRCLRIFINCICPEDPNNCSSTVTLCCGSESNAKFQARGSCEEAVFASVQTRGQNARHTTGTLDSDAAGRDSSAKSLRSRRKSCPTIINRFPQFLLIPSVWMCRCTNYFRKPLRNIRRNHLKKKRPCPRPFSQANPNFSMT